MLRGSLMSLGMGRKFSSNSRDRLISSFGFPGGNTGGGDGGCEFGEDDVWMTMEGGYGSKGEVKRAVAAAAATGGWNKQRWSAAGDGNQVGGLSLAFDGGGNAVGDGRILHQFRQPENSPAGGISRHSAPVNVPDWSKILRESSTESSPEFADGDDDTDWVAPHEYLASARGRSSATSSVFEGAGRTLKGRDMSRVRNAVWRQTGFPG